MLDGLIRKEYSIDIAGKVVKFKQLTIMECLEFYFYSKQKDFNLYEWLNNLFNEKLSYKSVDIDKLMGKLYKTAFKGFFDEKKEDKEMIEKEKLKADFEYLAFLISLSGFIKLDPISILEKYTPEQLILISKGLTYKINEETEKGRLKNAVMLESLTIDVNNEIERVKKAREKAKNFNNKVNVGQLKLNEV